MSKKWRREREQRDEERATELRRGDHGVAKTSGECRRFCPQ